MTLAHPPANAMDTASLNELADIFDRLANDVGVTAVVITGEGRSFSAGLDLKAIQHSEPGHQEELIEALNRAFLAVYSCPRLVVGAVNGHAIAGGLVLALCCDIRLVADVDLKVGTRRGSSRRAVPGRRDRGSAPRALATDRPSAGARRRLIGGPRRRRARRVRSRRARRRPPRHCALRCSRSQAASRLRADQGAAPQAGDRGHTSRARRT